jgi:hypothetical protein
MLVVLRQEYETPDHESPDHESVVTFHLHFVRTSAPLLAHAEPLARFGLRDEMKSPPAF